MIDEADLMEHLREWDGKQPGLGLVQWPGAWGGPKRPQTLKGKKFIELAWSVHRGRLKVCHVAKAPLLPSSECPCSDFLRQVVVVR